MPPKDEWNVSNIELRDTAFRKEIDAIPPKSWLNCWPATNCLSHQHCSASAPSTRRDGYSFSAKSCAVTILFCRLSVFRVKAGKILSDTKITELLANDRTEIVNGANSKQAGKTQVPLETANISDSLMTFPEVRKHFVSYDNLQWLPLEL